MAHYSYKRKKKKNPFGNKLPNPGANCGSRNTHNAIRTTKQTRTIFSAKLKNKLPFLRINFNIVN